MINLLVNGCRLNRAHELPGMVNVERTTSQITGEVTQSLAQSVPFGANTNLHVAKTRQRMAALQVGFFSGDPS